eukprot:7904925-Lingulodinium_polyedra.AAC.1
MYLCATATATARRPTPPRFPRDRGQPQLDRYQPGWCLGTVGDKVAQAFATEPGHAGPAPVAKAQA